MTFLLLLVGASTEGASLKITPGISLERAWDSNVLASSVERTPDLITRASPSLTATIGTRDVVINLGYRIEGERYVVHDRLNSNSSAKDLRLSVDQPIELSSRFTLKPFARYNVSRDSVRSAREQQDSLTSPSPTETLLSTPVRRTDLAGSLFAQWISSPRGTLDFSGRAGKRSFDSDRSDLIDHQDYSASLGGSRAFLPNLTIRGQARAEYTHFETRNKSRKFGSGISGTYAFSPFTRLIATLDLSHLRTEIDPKTSWVLDRELSLQYADPGYWWSIGAAIGVFPDNFGLMSKRESMSLSGGKLLAADWQVNLYADLQKLRSLREPFSVDLLIFNANSSLKFRAMQNVYLELSGNLTRQRNTGGFGGDLKRESVTATVEANTDFPIF